MRDPDGSYMTAIALFAERAPLAELGLYLCLRFSVFFFFFFSAPHCGVACSELLE